MAGAAARQPPASTCDLALSQRSAASGRESFTLKNYAAAVEDFRRALDACPSERWLLLEFAQALTYQRQFGPARRAVAEFLAAQPDSEAGLLMLANVEFMSQQFPECLRAVGRVLSRNGTNLAALKLKANAQYLSGRDQEAVETFQAVLALNPKDEEAHYSLGRIYYQQNRFEPAMASFTSVLGLNPKSYKAYDNLGLCYEALGQDQDAIRHYMKALELVYQEHPEYDWPYANLANLLLKLGDNEKALDLAAEAAQRNPNSARNFYLTARALSRLDRSELAIKWLRRAIELDPVYPEPHYLLAQLYQKQGLKEQSEREFRAFQEIRAKQPGRPR